MKLNKRERFLIIALIALLICVLGYKVIYPKIINTMIKTEEEYNQKKIVYDDMMNSIKKLPEYRTTQKKLTQEISEINKFILPAIEQEKIIVFVNKYMAQYKIDATSISFTDVDKKIFGAETQSTEEKPQDELDIISEGINATTGADIKGAAAEINEIKTGETADTQQSADSAEATGAAADHMSVSISFSCAYADLLNLIDSIQSNIINISVPTVSVVSSPGNRLQGTMVMDFYAVSKLADDTTAENKEWIWKDLFKSGKPNPFTPMGAAILATAADSGESDRYDFYMSVKPDSSDLPTVMIGKDGDTDRASYVYGDSNAVDTVNIKFKAEKGKYFYKYSTKTEEYPKGTAWQEFVPYAKKDIKIKIYSVKRNSTTDSSGVSIYIDNKSGLKVNVDIDDDDTVQPRVYFQNPKAATVVRK